MTFAATEQMREARDAVPTIQADTQLAPDVLAHAGEPTWIWDGSAGVLLWANAAAIQFWGARSEAALLQASFDRAMPALARLRTLSGQLLPHDGQEETLVFWTARGARRRRCLCRHVAFAGRSNALLVTDPPAPRGTRPAPATRPATSPTPTPREAEKLCWRRRQRTEAPAREPTPSAEDVATMNEIARMIRSGQSGAKSHDEAAGDTAAAPACIQPAPDPTLWLRLASGCPAQAGPAGDLLAHVGHEVRTPLTAIIGFAELMKEARLGPIGNSHYESYVADIHESACHALSLVNDLLDIAKIRAGGLDLEPTRVDLDAIIRQCMSAMRPIADKHGIALEERLVPDLPAIVADWRSLRQILLNLLSNAVKFTKPGGRVWALSEFRPDGPVAVAIEDNGIGMTASETRAALEPFGQIDGAPRHREGTGLGLPIAKALAEANGAEFRIESAPGEGTRVTLIFPPERIAPFMDAAPHD